MALRIAVIGGGWYGCHIASSLLALGFSVRLFEAHDRLFHEASGNNQFRLHLGFHYPRHSATRVQSRDGYSRFVERYPGLSQVVPENIYAVPHRDTLMDYQTYRLVMTSTGVDFSETARCSVELTDIDGYLTTTERVLLLAKARAYFHGHLSDVLELGHKVTAVEEQADKIYLDGEAYDFVVDATWGHFSRPEMEVIYEPTMLLYFEGPKSFPAITLVDGPLCSIYPTEERGVFTLSSVPHTPLGRSDSGAGARAIRDAVTAADVDRKVALMTEQVSRYVPSFRDSFRFLGPQLSVKTKPVGASDDRSCHVWKRGRVFSVMSGKIDTVFFAVERILALFEADQGIDAPDVRSTLRQDIARERASTGLSLTADAA